ncbi:MAG: acid shock protein [Aeromonadaceae bacterium]
MKKLLTLTIATLFGLSSAISMAATTASTPTHQAPAATSVKHKKHVAAKPAVQKTQATQTTLKHKKHVAAKPAVQKTQATQKSTKHKKHVAASSSKAKA